ncbi:MAG: hypothetical protein KDE09_02855 [Anaerolineales bacterium]|nr:hypothetical protein [Anaerolineales bacterium]MCB0004878.1 hypothetical protein [Anaerolineales bacterium]MCB0016699.1 hypothetical protein [Anaerolineales bacterium]MCB0026432.1 hypothetical protein [Anaerolineales bacterium]MCB8961977.1 hypothetical protein [Ardenticatenales bacterium]
MRGRRAIPIAILIFGVLLLAIFAVVYFLQTGNDDTADAQPSSTPAAEAETGGEGEIGEATPDELAIAGTPTPQQFEFSDPNAPEAQLIEVVVSLQTVPRGWLMTEAELTTEMRLASEVPLNVITDMSRVIGRYARNDIFQGETLTTDALVIDPTLIGEEEFGPSSLIPFGFVAQSVPMEGYSGGVAYALRPGDSVDVMISFIFIGIDEDLETFLPNAATILLVEEDEEGNSSLRELTIDPYGRFEQLPTGAIAHVGPQEDPRPILVTFVIQNARVINVGTWDPPGPVQPPTPTPDPDAAEEPEGATATPTREIPTSLVIALPPQQQLLVKYALERDAAIDFALRSANDGQLNNIENITLEYIINRFNIEIPPKFNYTAIGKQLFVILEGGCNSLPEGTIADGNLSHYCYGTGD